MMTNMVIDESERLRSFARALDSNPHAETGVMAPPKLEVNRLNFYYGKFHALTDIDLQFLEHRITAIIGPSGCGKSTLLRTLNRMGDLIPNSRTEGEIRLDGQNILAPSVDVIDVRRRVGMVFQRSGMLVEFAPTTQMFTRPKDKRTENYISGRFG